jgi:hypothetical protein
VLRAVFIALLLVNLLYFAWAAWLRAPEPVVVSNPPKAPRLLLATEAPPPPPKRCVSVGPFPDIAAAERAATVLQEGGYEPVQREEQGKIVDGYWVFLPSPANARAEQRLLERLRRGGVRDAYPIDDAAIGRAISLGVFSDPERARTQASRVSRLNVEAQVSPRERETVVRWINFQLRTDAPELDASAFQIGGTQLEMRACPAIVAAPGGDAAAAPDASAGATGESVQDAEAGAPAAPQG